MAHLTIENGTLTVTMQGLDRILALRGHLSVPLAHIRGVAVRPPEAFAFFHGFKIDTNWCGDEEARAVVEQLTRDAGYEPVYSGSLGNAAAQERLIGTVFAIAQGGLGPFLYRMAPPDQL
jgi:hypothetical protein